MRPWPSSGRARCWPLLNEVLLFDFRGSVSDTFSFSCRGSQAISLQFICFARRLLPSPVEEFEGPRWRRTKAEVANRLCHPC